jgi:hypothetical protein
LTKCPGRFSIFIVEQKLGVYYEKRWIENKIGDKTERPGDSGRIGLVGVDWLRVHPGD